MKIVHRKKELEVDLDKNLARLDHQVKSNSESPARNPDWAHYPIILQGLYQKWPTFGHFGTGGNSNYGPSNEKI